MSLPAWASQNAAVGGGHVAKSAAITVGSGAVRLACSLATAVILTRLLSPEDFGIITMVAPLLAFAMVFADAGASNHTLQVKKLDQKELTLTFWISAVTAVITFITFIALAPLIASFYGEERLTMVTYVLACSLLMTPLLSQHNALVKKCFRQDLYGIAEIVGAIFGLVTGVALALNGYGYWALVSIPIGRHMSHAATIWLLTGWVPGRPYIDVEKTKLIFTFGAYMIFARAFTEFGKNLDKVLIGWKYGTVEAGFYGMAYSIMMLPFMQIMSPVGGAMIPYFSQIKDSADKLNDGLNNVAVALGVIITPIMLWAALMSNNLLVFVTGEKWAPAAPIFSFLALASIGSVMGSILGWLLVAAGKPGKLAKWMGISLASLIACYLIGLRWGSVGVAAAHMINVSLLFFFLVRYAAKAVAFEQGRLIFTIGKVTLAGIFAVFTSHLTLELTGLAIDQHLPRLTLSFSVLALTYPFFFILLFGKTYFLEICHFVRRRKGY